MAVAAHKGAIAFGLVYIPIQLYRTTREDDISFNQLCKETMERVKYKKFCAGCQHELSPKDIVKGYQYEKDKYVIMEESDFEKIKTKQDKTIQILQFSELGDIDAKYYEKNYYALPVAGGEKPFQLLATALRNAKKVAIAKTVLGTKENLLALCPTRDGILVKTLFYESEMLDAPGVVDQVTLAKEEVAMAGMLIDSMTKPFEPKKYQDEYQMRLRDAIATKINGKEIVAASEDEPNLAVDLMEALQRSLDLSSAANKTKTKSQTVKKASKETVEEKPSKGKKASESKTNKSAVATKASKENLALKPSKASKESKENKESKEKPKAKTKAKTTRRKTTVESELAS